MSLSSCVSETVLTQASHRSPSPPSSHILYVLGLHFDVGGSLIVCLPPHHHLAPSRHHEPQIQCCSAILSDLYACLFPRRIHYTGHHRLLFPCIRQSRAICRLSSTPPSPVSLVTIATHAPVTFRRIFKQKHSSPESRPRSRSRPPWHRHRCRSGGVIERQLRRCRASACHPPCSRGA